VAVERSDTCGDKVPSPVQVCARWLRDHLDEVSTKKERSVGQQRITEYQVLFNTDSHFQIPDDEDPKVVEDILSTFVQHLTDAKDGKTVTLLGGKTIDDHALSRKLRGALSPEEKCTFVRHLLQELPECNVATLECICLWLHAQVVSWQQMDFDSHSVESNKTDWAKRLANRFFAMIEEILQVMIENLEVFDGLTPYSRRKEESASQLRASMDDWIDSLDDVETVGESPHDESTVVEESTSATAGSSNTVVDVGGVDDRAGPSQPVDTLWELTSDRGPASNEVDDPDFDLEPDELEPDELESVDFAVVLPTAARNFWNVRETSAPQVRQESTNVLARKRSIPSVSQGNDSTQTSGQMVAFWHSRMDMDDERGSTAKLSRMTSTNSNLDDNQGAAVSRLAAAVGDPRAMKYMQLKRYMKAHGFTNHELHACRDQWEMIQILEARRPDLLA